MIQKERIQELNDRPVRDGAYVLYWMQAAQRADFNHALEYAIQTANERHKSLLAVFVLTDYPEANLRHYQFMLEGLAQTQKDLARRGILLAIQKGWPGEIVPRLAREADVVVADDGYLRIQRQWRRDIAEAIDCAMTEVATNVVVPVKIASDKENFSAGTLRPRICRQLKKFLVPMGRGKLECRFSSDFESVCLDNIEAALSKMKIDNSVLPSKVFKGGAAEAKRRLKLFIADKLNLYGGSRADPTLDIQSHLSPYLHFGQISPLEIVLAIKKTRSPGKEAFLEELIVRRELAFNYVWYNLRYDQYDALPNWALNTLRVHAKDKREYVYTLEQLEEARTHDPAWNAAQMEMVKSGKMHNYMRMYWGKKILEWTESPKQAFEWALYLNNKYELDGRDPNSFAGVAWCFGKHDRPWGERQIFGKVRYMNFAGLKRKFDIEAYIEKVKGL
ncbi:MAG: deoxyribodipyrimidine photolyase [Planctomycetes bacterium]|nr:deoxyribodipyrimidine photolyase [Planctomycetota bacterium]